MPAESAFAVPPTYTLSASATATPLNGGVSYPCTRVVVANLSFSVALNAGYGSGGLPIVIAANSAYIFNVDDASKVWIQSQSDSPSFSWTPYSAQTPNPGALVVPSSLATPLVLPRPRNNNACLFSTTFEAVQATAADDIWYNLNGAGLTTSSAHVRSSKGSLLSAKATGKLNLTNGQPIFLKYSLSTGGFDMRDCALYLSYYVENVSGLTSDGAGHNPNLIVRLFEDKAFVNGWGSGNLPLTPGRWHKVCITQSLFANTKLNAPSATWANPIQGINIVLNGTTGATNLPIIHFDCLEIVPHSGTKGGVVITWDGGYIDQINYGIKYLISEGIPSILYVSPPFIGNTAAGYANWSDIQDLYDTGLVDIGTHHTKNGQGFPYDNRPAAFGGPPSQQEKINYMLAARESLLPFGNFGPYATEHMAIPNGLDGSTTFGNPTAADIELMHQYMGMIGGSFPYWSGCDGTNNNWGIGPGSAAYIPKNRRINPWYMPRIVQQGGSGLAVLSSQLDKAVQDHVVYCIAVHNVSDSSAVPPVDFSLADWRTAVDAMAARASSGFEFLRVMDVML